MNEVPREFATFDEAKRSAFIKDLMSFVQRRPVDLLPFEAVKEKLRLKQLIDRGVQEVTLDRIVGSLGREHEFTRAFLPRKESLRKRWQEIVELIRLVNMPVKRSRIELCENRDVIDF